VNCAMPDPALILRSGNASRITKALKIGRASVYRVLEATTL
jgi:hypothetical protein